MDELTAVLDKVAGFLWGPWSPLIPFLLGVGLFLTIRYRFLQVRKFKHAVDLIGGRYENPKDEGEISHFQALSTALSATVGTGNIAGVATAIAAGGPGAIFDLQLLEQLTINRSWQRQPLPTEVQFGFFA